MEAILAYMSKRSFPRPLQRRVKRFYRRLFQETSAMDEKAVLVDLSTTLKNEVALFLVNDLVLGNPLFADVAPLQVPSNDVSHKDVAS